MSILKTRISNTPAVGLLDLYYETYHNATDDQWLEDDFIAEIPAGEYGIRQHSPQGYARVLIRDEIKRRCSW